MSMRLSKIKEKKEKRMSTYIYIYIYIYIYTNKLMFLEFCSIKYYTLRIWNLKTVKPRVPIIYLLYYFIIK
jgi:hypothetical protein